MSEGAAKKEEKPRKFQAIRGTRDLLPPETALWNRVEQTAHEVFATFGFGEIRPPIIENYSLFARAVGEESDIVAKELLISWDAPLDQWDALRVSLARRFDSWNSLTHKLADLVVKDDKSFRVFELKNTRENPLRAEQIEHYLNHFKKSFGELKDIQELRNYIVHSAHLDEWEKISLRPEATASVCRAYIEHSMQQLPQPVKLYYMGPMFRRERPQKGRYRQFYQIGAEVLGGSDAPAIDAEVIEMVITFFVRLRLQGVQLDINSIGDKNCRPKYVELLRAELLKVKDKLGPDSQRRIETNPLRVLDSKVKEEQPIIEKLPRIADHLCDDCKEHYAELKRQLDLRSVAYRENWRLVRGLDYYMRTTFEITAIGLGSQDAVCGGGRYDGLVELLGGPPTKGIGFAIGEDRVILSLVHGEPLPQRRNIDLVLAWLTPGAYPKAILIAQNLRREGIYVDLLAKHVRASDAVRYADRIGAYFTLLLGEDELKSGELTLKHMLKQEQIKITERELLEHLRRQNPPKA